MDFNKSKLQEYIEIIDNSAENFSLIKSAYRSNVQNASSDLNSITFDSWTDDVSQFFSDYKDELSQGIMTKLNNSIAAGGSLSKLDELLKDLKEKCQSCLNFMTDAKNKYLNVTLNDTDSNFRWDKETISSPEYAQTHEYISQETCASLNVQLQAYYSAISDTLTKISNLKFDDEGELELVATPTYTLPSDAIETPVVPAIEDVSVEPVIINQFDVVSVAVSGEGDTGLTDEQQRASDEYREQLENLSERTNGRIYIAEVANGDDRDESGRKGLKYYDNPADFLRALCNETGENINDYIGPDGIVNNAGYERIIDYGYFMVGPVTCTCDLIYYDPTGEHYQEFENAGVFSNSHEGHSFYDRFETIRCYDTVEDFESAYLEGNDDFLNDWIDGVNGGRLASSMATMISLGLIGSNSSAPQEEQMYYLGTDYLGRSYFSYSLDDDAKVYRGVAASDLGAAQTWLNDTDKLGDPLLGSGYAQARIGFVLTGGNTGDIVVKNILNGPNGAYTGNAAFNTSIVYDNPNQAPTVVSRGDSSYNASQAYHVVDIGMSDVVSLSDAKNSNFNVEAGVIVVQQGESILTRYGGIFGWNWTKEHQYIRGEEGGTYLVWDKDNERYYVFDGIGYSTSTQYMGGDYGRGYKYVTLESLIAGDTEITTVK